MAQQIRGKGRHLVYPIGPKKYKLWKERWDLASFLSQPIKGQGGHLFFQSARKHKLGRGSWDFASCQVLFNSVQRFQISEEKLKMYQPIRGQGGHLVFPIIPKNTKLVEKVKILFPVEFRWILFSGFRGEVENLLANQRPRRPSCFPDQPEKYKLGRGHWYLASCQVSLNSVQRFQKRRRKCEKLRWTTDERTTDDRRRTMALAQVH